MDQKDLFKYVKKTLLKSNISVISTVVDLYGIHQDIRTGKITDIINSSKNDWLNNLNIHYQSDSCNYKIKKLNIKDLIDIMQNKEAKKIILDKFKTDYILIKKADI